MRRPRVYWRALRREWSRDGWVCTDTLWVFAIILALFAVTNERVVFSAKEFLREFSGLDLNEKGDFLAGIFSSLAFIAALLALWFQRRELQAQQEEFRGQRVATEKIAEISARQSFDNFFFGLVDTLNSIIGAMDLRKTGKSDFVAQGRDCFRTFYKDVEPLSGSSNRTLEITLKRYSQMYEKYRHDLGHYFRFVHNSMRDVEQEQMAELRHRKIFRALFSDDELLIIFYNCFTKQGENMIPYAEAFDLFDNLPKDRLVNLEHWNDYRALVRELP